MRRAQLALRRFASHCAAAPAQARGLLAGAAAHAAATPALQACWYRLAPFVARFVQHSRESHQRHGRRAARKRAARLCALASALGAARSATLAAPRALAFGSRAAAPRNCGRPPPASPGRRSCAPRLGACRPPAAESQLRPPLTRAPRAAVRFRGRPAPAARLPPAFVVFIRCSIRAFATHSYTYVMTTTDVATTRSRSEYGTVQGHLSENAQQILLPQAITVHTRSTNKAA